jgi:hypothetical protein
MNEIPLLSASPVQPKSSALAIWSLVLGILGLTCFSIFSALPGIICGHMAYSRIKRSAGVLTGSGLALAGLITGYLAIALSLILIPMTLAIAIPNFVRARTMAQTNMCLNNLKQIEGAKQQWALENKKLNSDSPAAADLDSYLKSGFHSLKCPAGGTYMINPVDQNASCSVAEHHLPGN